MKLKKGNYLWTFMTTMMIQIAYFSCSTGQSFVTYDVSFENAAHHEAEISVTFTGVTTSVLEARMSRSSPGRYALHEFAKNVYNVRAEDGTGNALEITRPNAYQWDISGHNGTVKVTYTLFADRPGGTYAGIDEAHAHLNMPAVFMWARGLEEYPIEVRFHPLPDWKIATQLSAGGRSPSGGKEESGANTYSAPNLQYFLDSPTELSDFELREWQVESGGNNYTFQLQVHHDGTDAEVDSYTEMVKSVVNEQKAIFGELPDFDFGRYTFLACYLPYAAGDGMEHRNSTSLTSSRSLSTSALGLLGTVSHEFFHVWNVERIRPRTLEPFNFEQANMSHELWFAEGFTSYYGTLVLRRAGFRSIEQYSSSLSGGLNAVINSPGRTFFTPVEMSRQAPFVDAARSVDPVNVGNTFISYYTYGSAIALGLDLTLRTKFDRMLDEYMQAVWMAHGKPEIPYTVSDLEKVLGDFTGDRQFASNFFANYVNGHEVVDYEELLSHAGLLLRKRNAGHATLGRSPGFQNGMATIRTYTSIGSPFYNAGLDVGDRIIMIDNKAVSNGNDYQALLQSHKPDDTVSIQYINRAGRNKTANITFAEDRSLEVVLYENASMQVTDEMQKFRERWLGSQIK